MLYQTYVRLSSLEDFFPKQWQARVLNPCKWLCKQLCRPFFVHRWGWYIDKTFHVFQQFIFLSCSAFLCAGCMFDPWVFTEILELAQHYGGLLFLAVVRSPVVFAEGRKSVSALIRCFLYMPKIHFFLWLFAVIVRIKHKTSQVIVVPPEYECWYQDFSCFLVKSLQWFSLIAALLTQKSKLLNQKLLLHYKMKKKK